MALLQDPSHIYIFMYYLHLCIDETAQLASDGKVIIARSLFVMNWQITQSRTGTAVRIRRD